MPRCLQNRTTNEDFIPPLGDRVGRRGQMRLGGDSLRLLRVVADGPQARLAFRRRLTHRRRESSKPSMRLAAETEVPSHQELVKSALRFAPSTFDPPSNLRTLQDSGMP
jgi:hypothetical protein